MKILIINSSPHKNGDTSYIVNKLCESDNVQADVIHTYFIDNNPCTDCRKCISTGKCIFNDKTDEILYKIDDYEAIVLASPLYYNQPNGSLLNFVSRFQLFYNTNKKLKPKKGGIILVGGGDKIVNAEDAKKTMRIALRGLNISEFCYIESLHTSTVPACNDKSIDRQIEDFVLKLSD